MPEFKKEQTVVGIVCSKLNAIYVCNETLELEGDRRHEKGDRRSEKGDRRSEKGDWRSEKGDIRSEKGDRRSEKGDIRPSDVRRDGSLVLYPEKILRF